MTEVEKTYSQMEVQQLIREAQENQARWIYLDTGFRECLNHMKRLCFGTKEDPLPTYDERVYHELDALFSRVRDQYLGVEPAQEPVPATDEAEPE